MTSLYRFSILSILACSHASYSMHQHGLLNRHSLLKLRQEVIPQPLAKISPSYRFTQRRYLTKNQIKGCLQAQAPISRYIGLNLLSAVGWHTAQYISSPYLAILLSTSSLGLLSYSCWKGSKLMLAYASLHQHQDQLMQFYQIPESTAKQLAQLAIIYPDSLLASRCFEGILAQQGIEPNKILIASKGYFTKGQSHLHWKVASRLQLIIQSKKNLLYCYPNLTEEAAHAIATAYVNRQANLIDLLEKHHISLP